MSKREEEKHMNNDEGKKTSYCPKCGREITTATKFCPKCGTNLREPVRHLKTEIERRPARETSILGFVSAGVILILIAFTYIRNPVELSVFIDYFESMGQQDAFIKPPAIIFDAAIFFFYAAGVWGIVLSGLRIVIERNTRKAGGDFAGGLFALFLAFLATNYAADVFTGKTTLAYFIMAVGVLVVFNVILHFALPGRTRRT